MEKAPQPRDAGVGRDGGNQYAGFWTKDLTGLGKWLLY